MTDIDDQLTQVFKATLRSELPNANINRLSDALCAAVCRDFAGRSIYVPKGWVAHRAARLFNGRNANELCAQYKIPRSTFHRIVTVNRKRPK